VLINPWSEQGEGAEIKTGFYCCVHEHCVTLLYG
jgi:hypothetical protein